MVIVIAGKGGSPNGEGFHPTTEVAGIQVQIILKAYLYNRKKPIISVDVENGVVVEIKEVVKENEHLLPVLFLGETKLTLETLNKWLDTRKLSEKREGIKQARDMFRGFDAHYHMLSLSDQYWFRYKKSEKWDQLNFFTNPYNQEQGLIFFEPWLVNPEVVTNVEGPDLTTNGLLRKRWILEGHNSYLIKAGSKIFHQEPLSEVLASITLEKLGLIPYVKYELIIYGMRFCSKCENFITQHTEFVPAMHVLSYKTPPADEYKYKHFIRMCHELQIVGAEEYMEKMIAVDHILCNTDRHFANFGFIRDSETGKILGFAPLFDFGRAYWGSNYSQDVTSRFFKDVEESCFKRFIKKVDVDRLVDTKDMEKMVEKYPELSDSQVKLIQKKIHRVNHEISKVKMPKRGPQRD